MRKLTCLSVLPALALLFVASKCGPLNEPEVAPAVFIHIAPKCNGKDLVLNTLTYINAAGDTFSVKTLNYYISNIKLKRSSDGFTWAEPKSYHLINGSGEHVININNVPATGFDELAFSVGVDSSANHKLDNPGDLDPANGMAWDWNTGYKFFVMEGSRLSKGQTKTFTYHVGTDANYRTLSFPFSALQAGKYIKTEHNQTAHLLLDAEADEIFKSPNLIHLEKTNNVMNNPATTDSLANNYASGMFRLTEIH
ncbi:MAG: MbnP family protein [Bacteroidota bacterium]